MWRIIIALAMLGFVFDEALAQGWVYQQFGNFGNNWSANNQRIPQGAAGYGGTVRQPPAYAAPPPVQQPQPQQYYVPRQSYQPAPPVQLNPALTNPNNIVRLQPPPPPPKPAPAPTYRTYNAPVTGFKR